MIQELSAKATDHAFNISILPERDCSLAGQRTGLRATATTTSRGGTRAVYQAVRCVLFGPSIDTLRSDDGGQRFPAAVTAATEAWR